MNLSRLLVLLTAALLLGMVPACKKDSSGKVKIAVVTNNDETFWSYCEAGARKAAKNKNVELIFRKPAKGDFTTQMNIIRDLESQGIAGLSVSVINPEEQAPELKILAGKMKLVTMDNDAAGSDRICYIGTDNYAAGHMVGRLIREVMPEGTLAIFVGQSTPINARERFWGLVDELNGVKERKDFPKPSFEGLIGGKYRLYRNEAITDNADRTEAFLNAQRALEKIGGEKNVCLVGLWAYNPPKILEAVRSDAKYKHVKIVGFDEDPDTLSGIDSGEIHASVVQDPFKFGERSVEILAEQARGNTKEREDQPIPYRVATKEGGGHKTIDGVKVEYLKAAEYRDFLKKLLEEVK